MRCDPDEPDTDVGSIEMKLVPALVTDYTCTYPWMFRYRTVQGLLKKDGMENIRESERNPLPCARSGGVMLVAWAQMLEAVRARRMNVAPAANSKDQAALLRLLSSTWL